MLQRSRRRRHCRRPSLDLDDRCHAAAPPASATLTQRGPCGAGTRRGRLPLRRGRAPGRAAAEHQQRLRDARRELSERGPPARRGRAPARPTPAQRRQGRGAAGLPRGTRAGRRTRPTSRPPRPVAAPRSTASTASCALAERRADAVAAADRDSSGALPGIELAADAARIAAEAAQVACLEARRALAACEEEAQRRVAASGQSTSGCPVAAAAAAAPAAPPRRSSRGPCVAPTAAPIAAADCAATDRRCSGWRCAWPRTPASRPAGCSCCCSSCARQISGARARGAMRWRFPADHPFWSQFAARGRRPRRGQPRRRLGYRFDGRGGWADGRAPTVARPGARPVAQRLRSALAAPAGRSGRDRWAVAGHGGAHRGVPASRARRT